MTHIQLYFHHTIVACLILVCTTVTTFAQQTMLMGKITDEHNKPIAGAVLHLQGKDNKERMATSDNKGLFTSAMIQTGKYLASIELGKQRLKAGTIVLSATGSKKYYYCTLTGNNKVTVTASARNPYMESKLNEVAANDIRIDVPKKGWRVANDRSIHNDNTIHVFDSASSPKVMTVEEK